MILGLLMVSGGAVSIALGYSVQRRDQVLKNWPSVPGTVVSCSIVKTTQARLRVPATRGGASPEPTYRQDPVWAIVVEYHYSVDGKMHTGHEATSALLLENVRGNESAPSDRMRSLAARISPEAHADVHYDSVDPHQSYLIYIDDPGKARLFQTGGICMIGGILVAGCSKLL